MAPNWQVSLDRVASLMAKDGDEIAPPSRTQFLNHGAPTPPCTCCFTAIPIHRRSFREIAQAYFDAGSNVLVPRIPYHGYLDPADPRARAT